MTATALAATEQDQDLANLMAHAADFADAGADVRTLDAFDEAEAATRRRAYRARLLDLGRRTVAADVAAALACVEIVDLVWNDLLRFGAADDLGRRNLDAMVLPAQGGRLLQSVLCEDRQAPSAAMTAGPRRQGLAEAVVRAQEERIAGRDGRAYAVLTSAERENGALWEAAATAGRLRLANIFAFVADAGGDSVSGARFALDAALERFNALGWETASAPSGDAVALRALALGRSGEKPFVAICSAGFSIHDLYAQQRQSTTV